jgi:hypothetical protein
MTNEDLFGEQPVENPYFAPQGRDAGGSHTRGELTLNPWTSIWFRPRATIRQIVDTDPKYMVIPLAMAVGAVRSLQRVTTTEMLDGMSLTTAILIMSGVGLVLGPIGLYGWGWLVRWTGGWLGGGVATPEEARAALAWGHLPTVALIPIFLANLLLFGTDAGGQLILEVENTLFAAMRALIFCVFVWTTVSLTKCVAEVHRFSAWRGFFTVLVSQVLFLLAVVAAFKLVFAIVGQAVA